MRAFRPVSLPEQVAAHLRREVEIGGIGQTMPGVQRLAAELGVHHTTAEEALRILEKEGLLIPQGAGKRRLVSEAKRGHHKGLRIGMLPYEALDRTQHFLLEIRHRLQEAGHSASFCEKSLTNLGMNPERVARYASEQDVDAWVTIAAPRGILEWFVGQPKPVFSIFGSRSGLNVPAAGPDKLTPILHALDRLVALGHQRIAILLREEHRKPKPGVFAQSLLDAMESHGIKTGPYNLPDWDDNADDYRRCLDALFHVTPPTALIIDEVFLFNLAVQHLARRGIHAPQHISMLCGDPDPSFAWFSPSVAHIRWDSEALVRRVLAWANNTARGKADFRQITIKAEFVNGEMIGPVPSER